LKEVLDRYFKRVLLLGIRFDHLTLKIILKLVKKKLRQLALVHHQLFLCNSRTVVGQMIPLLAVFKVRVLFQNIAVINAAFQLLLGRLHVLDSHQFVNELLLLDIFLF
jgi:hypothetical protein